MKKFLTMLALLCSVTANAQGPDFPVTLAKVELEPSTTFQNEATRVTWHSTVPGLSFCVAYSALHGAFATTRSSGHPSTYAHCLVSDRNGNATDVLIVGLNKSEGDGFVLANVVLAGDQFNTVVIPSKQIHFSQLY